MAEIKFKGQPVKTIGKLPAIGRQAPDFLLTKTDLTDIGLSAFAGKRIVLNIFPSIETPVCARSVRRFNAEADTLNNTVVLCVSRDLPFAHERFNGAEGLKHVVSVSELRNTDFGNAYGVRMVDGPLAGLFARALVLIDEKGAVIYTQLVPEIAQEPDYEPVLRILRPDAASQGQPNAAAGVEVCQKASVAEHARLEDDDNSCDDGRSGKI